MRTVPLSKLTYRRARDLLEVAESPLRLTIQLDTPGEGRALPLAVLLVGLASRDAVITFELLPGFREVSPGVVAGILGAASRTQSWEETGSGLRAPRGWVADGGFVHPTAELSCRTLQGFRQDLLELMREASVPTSRANVGALARMGLEAVSNAEEHGYVTPDGDEVPLRFLVVEHIQSPYQPWGQQRVPTGAEAYLRAYREAQEVPEGGWIQMIVADAGSGMPYPRHRVMAEAAGWDKSRWSVYSEKVDVELATMATLLNGRGTTKGKWGRVLNRATPPGQGTNEMKLSVGLARGHTGVLTGRCYAHWGFPRPNLAEFTDKPLAPFEVEDSGARPIVGTVWWTVFPNTAQGELPIDVR